MGCVSEQGALSSWRLLSSRVTIDSKTIDKIHKLGDALGDDKCYGNIQEYRKIRAIRSARGDK